jgi:hypothetical protein
MLLLSSAFLCYNIQPFWRHSLSGSFTINSNHVYVFSYKKIRFFFSLRIKIVHLNLTRDICIHRNFQQFLNLYHTEAGIGPHLNFFSALILQITNHCHWKRMESCVCTNNLAFCRGYNAATLFVQPIKWSLTC